MTDKNVYLVCVQRYAHAHMYRCVQKGCPDRLDSSFGELWSGYSPTQEEVQEKSLETQVISLGFDGCVF